MQCEPPAGQGGGFGGWSCTRAHTRRVGRFFNSSGLVKRAQGLAGMAELRPLFPGGRQEEEQTTS
jgi:hypothetical protein